MTIADQVYEQAKLLTEPLAREALDFLLFLRSRFDRVEFRDPIEAHSASLAAMWHNAEGEAWDGV